MSVLETLLNPDSSGGGGGGNVVVTSSALPANAAQETGGNLATLAANQTNGTQKATVLPGSYAFTSATPAISTATSTTLLAAGTYHYIEIQNNSAQNIAISLSGAVLTGITAGSGNSCIVLAPGQEWFSPPGATPSGAITVYQTSGGSINTVTVVSA